MQQKFKSRKFIMMNIVVALATLVPIVFHLLGISDPVTMTVLGIYSVVGVGYTAINASVQKVVGAPQAQANKKLEVVGE